VNSNAFLQLPPGSTGLFLEEAAAHQAAIDATNALFARWGYTMVHTPMVDFFDAHSHMISEEEENRLYRMIGRDGEVLMLRSDITVFLLKHYQSLLKGAKFPVRLSYSDSILRHEDSIDISRNEHYQAGAELIGTRRRDGDLEILLLLCENLRMLGIGEAAIHLGSQALFSRMFPPGAGGESGGDGGFPAALASSIRSRDWEELSRLSAGEYPEARGDIVSLFSAIADADDPRALATIKASAAFVPGADDDIDYLADLAGTVRRYFPDFRLRIDPSEIGQRHYYSGLVFQVYLPDLPYAVASGGRYDSLIAEMGMDSGAVGYQVMLSAIGRRIGAAPSADTVRLSELEPEAPLEDRYETAVKLRGEGKNVCL
jgi:ATP phosphoribosyltransferase regulatory subunit